MSASVNPDQSLKVCDFEMLTELQFVTMASINGFSLYYDVK